MLRIQHTQGTLPGVQLHQTIPNNMCKRDSEISIYIEAEANYN